MEFMGYFQVFINSFFDTTLQAGSLATSLFHFHVFTNDKSWTRYLGSNKYPSVRQLNAFMP